MDTKSLSVLSKWNPAETPSEMVGAASCFLLFDDTTVILDSPMWCASIAERTLLDHGFSCKNLFCTFTEEKDFLFGIQGKREDTIAEAKISKDHILCIAVNCGPALVGDDLEGICRNLSISNPIVITDAGGFDGEYNKGYSKAAIALLKVLSPNYAQSEPNCVNLLGISPLKPMSGTFLKELSNYLEANDIHISYIAGMHNRTTHDLSSLGKASLNIVLNNERGKSMADYLFDQLKQAQLNVSDLSLSSSEMAKKIVDFFR